MSDCTIRPEASSDIDKITHIIDQASEGKPYADGDESELVVRLRNQNALVLSLVAELDSQVVGQITFSPVEANDGTQGWYALGPVAVYPELQSQGIGGQLIIEGLAEIKRIGGVGCMLTGNPVYYRRFGFEFSPGNCPGEEPADFFMVKRLTDQPLPSGPLAFHPAFYE